MQQFVLISGLIPTRCVCGGGGGGGLMSCSDVYVVMEIEVTCLASVYSHQRHQRFPTVSSAKGAWYSQGQDVLIYSCIVSRVDKG